MSSIEEMSQLRDWSVAIARFIGSIPEAASLSRQMEEVIHQAFERRDLRGLRMVARDVAEWATDLSPEQQQQLDALLVSRFGRGLKDQRKDVEREIARILRRGQIETEGEYRLLMARVDEIYADESKAEELEQINRLVLAFRQDAMGE